MSKSKDFLTSFFWQQKQLQSFEKSFDTVPLNFWKKQLE
jgi:hypothetical protein